MCHRPVPVVASCVEGADVLFVAARAPREVLRYVCLVANLLVEVLLLLDSLPAPLLELPLRNNQLDGKLPMHQR